MIMTAMICMNSIYFHRTSNNGAQDEEEGAPLIVQEMQHMEICKHYTIYSDIGDTL